MPDENHVDTDEVIQWQQEQWGKGNRVSIEQAMRRFDVTDHEVLLDLIYSEVLLREDSGESVSQQEYVERFPSIEEKICRQFLVHRSLVDDPTTLDGDTETHREEITVADERGASPAGVKKPVSESLPQIPGFSIQSIAGRGGSGVAYRALDLKLNRMVAIKLLHRTSAYEKNDARLLMREAESSAALLHPNIVPIFQVGEVDEQPFLVMEFIDGGSLADRLREGPLPVNEAVNIATQVANAIAYAHRSGLIHRDLKPGNILINSQGKPVVCDFGLARRLDSSETVHATGDVLGTPAYMPPEQARGERVDERADVYAIGAVLYESLTGRPPFQAATAWEILHQVMTDDVPLARQLNSALPKDLETICQRCLEKNALRRYSSASEVFDELERFRSGKPILARPLGRIARLVKWTRRNPAIATAVAISFVSLLAITLIAVLSQRNVSASLETTTEALQAAERQRDVAVNAINDLVYRVHDDLQKRQASVEARGEVLQSAINGLKTIVDVAGDREDTRVTLATALTRYGFILSQQGKNEDAEQQYRQSITVADSLTSHEGRQQRAQNYSNFALFYIRVANFEAARQWAEKTLAAAQEVLRDDDQNADMLNVVVQAKSHLAAAASVLQDNATALNLRQEAQEEISELYKRFPDKAELRDQLVDTNLLLIQDCISGMQFDQAERYIRESLEVLKTQNPEQIEDVQVRRRYASALRFDAMIHFVRAEYEPAIAQLNAALTVAERMSEVEPGRPGFHLRLSAIHETLADCYLATDRMDKCRHHLNIQIEELRKAMELGGQSMAVQRFSVAKALFSLANICTRQGDLNASVEMYRESIEEVQSIAQMYAMEEAIRSVEYVTEVVAGVAGLDSKADDSDIQAAKRSISAWQKLLEGNAGEFSAAEEPMVKATLESTREEVRTFLSYQLVACYAQSYKLAAQSGEASEADLDRLERKTIEAFKQILTGRDADPLMPVRLPEFDALRKNESFMQQVGFK